MQMIYHFDALMQEKHNSIANALELCLSCIGLIMSDHDMV